MDLSLSLSLTVMVFVGIDKLLSDDVDTETKADCCILLNPEFNTCSDNRKVFTAHFTVTSGKNALNLELIN